MDRTQHRIKSPPPRWHTGFGLLTRVLALVMFLAVPASAWAGGSASIVVLGDSLVAGYGLAPAEAFPVRMENRLRQEGLPVKLVNAGVSGDTTAGGLSRLEWSVPDDAAGVIVALGANDALRGIDPASTRSNLEEIVARLRARGQQVMLVGMLAPPNLGEEYGKRFNSIFTELANRHHLDFYPFFLEGVAARPSLNQADGMHPNAQGVSVMVDNMLPAVAAFVRRISLE